MTMIHPNLSRKKHIIQETLKRKKHMIYRTINKRYNGRNLLRHNNAEYTEDNGPQGLKYVLHGIFAEFANKVSDIFDSSKTNPRDILNLKRERSARGRKFRKKSSSDFDESEIENIKKTGSIYGDSDSNNFDSDQYNIKSYKKHKSAKRKKLREDSDKDDQSSECQNTKKLKKQRKKEKINQMMIVKKKITTMIQFVMKMILVKKNIKKIKI
ncbi:hypothetical protein EDEG_02168 [Edhazardia aedis USNM 41457]|uniref:Uncharacterized protein n=1 Tax=Edhazardia aedis (strain USNM 41457) TaxID=1003232 RepID=J9D7J6_EDHAE|nr:hypothetical protein EDEG_02168 [Edhazardia aedis USNM 41457]|eukprot:EJW03494.1 hypothetical protein EDEG_02168 [Edhazardia aedis USNM 41457]